MKKPYIYTFHTILNLITLCQLINIHHLKKVIGHDFTVLLFVFTVEDETESLVWKHVCNQFSSNKAKAPCEKVMTLATRTAA